MVAKEPESDRALKTVKLDPLRRIAAVRAGVVSNCAIKCLTFLDASGDPLAMLGVEDNSSNPCEIKLGEAESIVGVYGVKQPANVLYGLGFVIWKPPF